MVERHIVGYAGKRASVKAGRPTQVFEKLLCLRFLTRGSWERCSHLILFESNGGYDAKIHYRDFFEKKVLTVFFGYFFNDRHISGCTWQFENFLNEIIRKN